MKQKDTNITVINLFTNEDHKMIKKPQNNSELHPTNNNASHGSIAATNINAPVTINNNIHTCPSMLGFVKSFCGISDFFLKILPFQSKFPLPHALMSCKAIYF